MRLLFLGDVVGRSGRAAVIERLPGLRTAWGLDFVVVNGENASQGAGITGDHAKELLAAGADSNTLAVHRVDPVTGRLTYQTKGGINVPAPICIVFTRP